MREIIPFIIVTFFAVISIVKGFNSGKTIGFQNGWCEAKEGQIVFSRNNDRPFCLIDGQMVNIPRHR